MSRKLLLADWAWSESMGETFFQSGVLVAKPMRKTVQHKETLAKATQMIFHREEVLNIKLSCEKQTHDTALRMRVHNPDMLLKLAYYSGRQQNTPIQTSVQIRTTHHTSRHNTRLLGALSRRW